MTTYLVHRSDNATSAAQAARSFLESRPIEHNLVLTLLRERIEHPEPGRYWWISESGQVRGVAFRSPSTFAATVTPMPLDAIGSLVDAMAADAPDLPGVNGEAATTATFAGTWTERTGTGARPAEGQRLYRLDEVRPPAGVPGVLRIARSADVEQLVEWFVAFRQETGSGATTPGEVVERVAREVDARRFSVWEHDGEIVASAMATRAIVGVTRISFVYTAPDRRGSGFAAALVAGMAEHVVDAMAGRHPVSECILYTQLHNATSNRVYRRIGFRSVAEITAYSFDPADRPT